MKSQSMHLEKFQNLIFENFCKKYWTKNGF
jgi:hypothetical protein